MRNLLLVILFCFYTAGFSFADEYECGATWEPRIGFFASSLSVDSSNNATVDPPHLQNWLKENLPDTGSGTVTVRNIHFVSSENTLVRVDVLITENVERDGKITASLQISRKSSSGQSVSFFEKTMSVKKRSELDQFKVPFKQIVNTMQALLSEELKPTKIKYRIKTGKVQRDPHHPKIEIEIQEIHDKYGAIGLDYEGQKLYCFATRFLGENFVYSGTAAEAKSERETIGKTQTIKIDHNIFDQSCFKGLDACIRPIGSFETKVTKLFGVTQVSKLKNLDSEKEKVTFVCPVKIEQEPLLVFSPGENKNVSIKATDHNNKPIYGLWLEDIAVSPSNFGSINFQKDMTRDDGKNRLLKLDANDAVEQELAGVLVAKLCSSTAPDLLGFNENNQPVYWDLAINQKMLISALPAVDIRVYAEQRLNKINDMRFKSKDEEKHEHSTLVIKQTLQLDLPVQFKQRVFHPDYKEDSGFKGKLIEYTGEALARISAGEQKPSINLGFTKGWINSKKCGIKPYEYRSQELIHEFSFPSAPIPVYVFYRHFIPSSDSAIKNHPLEGLTFIEKNALSPAIKFRMEGYYQDHNFETDSCALNIEKNPVPAMLLPLLLDHSFPTIFSPYFEDGYGFEEVTVPLKENDMPRFRRKVALDGVAFDSLFVEKTISLGRNDVATDWEIPEDTENTKYDAELNRLNGTYILKSTAKTIRGKFDFREK